MDNGKVRSMTTIEQIEEVGIVPLITIEDMSDISFIGKCLIDGGLPCIEVAFRNHLAVEGIKEFRNKYPEILIGAGTVINVEQARAAVDAGAQFIISPGLDEEIVCFSKHSGILTIPGVASPTEIQKALKLEITNMKLFPAASLGGVSYMKAIAAPYNSVRFMPTGGINASNVDDYLKEKVVFACGGSWILPKSEIKQRRYENIMRIITDAINSVRTVRGK